MGIRSEVHQIFIKKFVIILLVCFVLILMKNFVISLSTAQQRRNHIVLEFSKHGVKFDFFDAITPDISEGAKRSLGLKDYTTQLHPNEVACLLSHMMLWKKAVDEELDYISIFEDDIYLGQEAASFLNDTSWIPSECGIIKLEVLYKKIAISLNQKIFRVQNDREIFVLSEPHMGCGGYILSKDTAQKLLEFIYQSTVIIPIDHFAFREYPEKTNSVIHQLVPALCVQDVILRKGQTMFPSALEGVRNQRTGKKSIKQSLNVVNKLNRELFRIISHIQEFLKERVKLLKGIKIIRLKFK